jgi:cysteine-rich repeat protein
MIYLRRTSFIHALIIGAAVAAAGCGDNKRPAFEDAGTGVDAAADAFPHVCGNSVVEPGEDCDDGDQVTDTVCDSTCHFTCGNGVVDNTFGEICDTGISTGTGSCPATCDDGMACTSDVMAGSDCQATCANSPITSAINGDGCCPPGATSLTDSDCGVACGNGIVEAGETCDTGIATGAGSCPTVAACSDGMSCTTDALIGAGTCTATCAHTPITVPANNDGCCPPGGTPVTDNDCVLGCGNGVVNTGETCDIAILAGAGSCPLSCSDGMACTRDVLTSPGTCTAACTFPTITMPANGDGCCPMGANHNTDTDCPARCGNGVVEVPEQCDDGNLNNNDACSNTCVSAVVSTAYRMSDLDLRDPHVFVNFLGCRDVTDTPLAGFSVNSSLQTSIQTDGTDADTLLDLSILTVFRPLIQADNNITTLEIHFGNCTSPMSSTSCAPGAAAPTVVVSRAFAATECLRAIAGTTHPYAPAITNAAAPCYISGPATLTINLGGIPVTLRDAQVAATYVGSPATTTVNGLLKGFISEADANATIIPAAFPLVGGMPLSSLLPGGDPPGPNNTNCAPYSDKDINNGVTGWWFYLNFTAPRVTWTGP